MQNTCVTKSCRGLVKPACIAQASILNILNSMVVVFLGKSISSALFKMSLRHSPGATSPEDITGGIVLYDLLLLRSVEGVIGKHYKHNTPHSRYGKDMIDILIRYDTCETVSQLGRLGRKRLRTIEKCL